MYNDTHIPGAKCPRCNNQLVVKTKQVRAQPEQYHTRLQFVGCSDYPKCIYRRPITEQDEQAVREAAEKFAALPQEF